MVGHNAGRLCCLDLIFFFGAIMETQLGFGISQASSCSGMAGLSDLGQSQHFDLQDVGIGGSQPQKGVSGNPAARTRPEATTNERATPITPLQPERLEEFRV